MRAPRTPLTTEFRGGYRAVRGRLENLFCPNARRRGGRLIAVVALLAGLAVGVYDNLEETAHGWHVESKFVPSMDPAQRQQLLHGWKRAVDAVLYWARED